MNYRTGTDVDFVALCFIKLLVLKHLYCPTAYSSVMNISSQRFAAGGGLELMNDCHYLLFCLTVM